MIGTCPRCGQTSQTSRTHATQAACPSCGHQPLVMSGAPAAAEVASEPLWGPALFVCMAVSLAVFIVALFAARAGAWSQEQPSTPTAHVSGH